MAPPISVTIITRDEEDRIADAVASAGWADEVVVLDSGSTDQTVELARAAGARVVVEEWRGYGAQKNRAAGLGRNRWVFTLDADERIGLELAAEIGELPAEPAHAAYRMRRRNRFAGRVIRHWPWSWDTSTRLFDRERCRYSEAAVHESLEIDGSTGELGGILEHLTYRGWDDYLRRQLRYARLGAEEAQRRGRRPRSGDLTVRPATTFLRHFIGRGYVLGGRLGWRLSALSAHGTWMKYLLLRELIGEERRERS